MPTSKQTKKPKKPKTQEKKIVNSPHSIGVKDCMNWPDKSVQKLSPQQKQAQNDNHTRPMKGALGKPTLRGYDLPEPTPRQDSREDDGTVREAMQGWPRGHKEEEEPVDEYEAYMNSLNQQENQSKIDKKKKNKKGSVENMDPKKDPHMSDLVSHRFMAEAIEERQSKLDKEREKEEKQKQLEQQRKFPKDIKATRTTQLRSIALAENVSVDPKDLWQMPKFKNNAKATLNTSRSKKGSGGSGGLGNDTYRSKNGNDAYMNNENGDTQGYGGCTCAEEQRRYDQLEITDPKEYASPPPLLAEGDQMAL